MVRVFLILILLLLASPVIGFTSSSEKIPIGIVPFHSPEKIWRLYSPFVDYLNKNTAYKWELRLFASHEDIKRAICADELSIALVGPFIAHKVFKQCGTEFLLLALNEDGKTGFRILIITLDDKLVSTKALVGKRIGLFKPNTATHIVTKKMLDEDGINEDNAKLMIFQTLERLVEETMIGSISAAGVRDNALKTLKNPKFKVLKTSEPVPGFVFVASGAVSKDIRRDFTKALLRLKPFKDNRDKRTVQDWDEAIKYGFILPSKDYSQQLEHYDLKYGRYAK